MKNILKNHFTNENTLYLGNKRVEVKKLTPNMWRKLFSTVDKLPGLIVQVLLAPKQEFYSYVISASELAMDEIVEIVSVLSGIEKSYLDEHAGTDEIIDYLVRTVKKNNLRDVIKNVKSLLPEPNKTER